LAAGAAQLECSVLERGQWLLPGSSGTLQREEDAGLRLLRLRWKALHPDEDIADTI